LEKQKLQEVVIQAVLPARVANSPQAEKHPVGEILKLMTRPIVQRLYQKGKPDTIKVHEVVKNPRVVQKLPWPKKKSP
jgi:hypothetical protein